MVSLLSKTLNTMASLKVTHDVFYSCTASICILLVSAVLSIASLFLLVALATLFLAIKLLEIIPSSVITMKRINESGDFDGYFTNYFGTVTCASLLLKAQVYEQLIMTLTGQRSSDGVRS